MKEINQISGSELPELLFTSKFKYDRRRLSPSHNLKYRNKPGGGFWTSPVGDGGESHWTTWSANESLDVLENRYHVALIPHARVLVIDSYEDLERAAMTYPYREEVEPEFDAYFNFLRDQSSPIDWESLSQDFDAVWLTQQGLYNTCNPYSSDYQYTLYSWDVETVFVLNTSVIDDVKPDGALA
jgi:hypothetical protein